MLISPEETLNSLLWVMRSHDSRYWHLTLRCDHTIYGQPVPGWEQVIKHNERNQGFVIICAWKVYLTWVTALVHPFNILDTLHSFSSQWNYFCIRLIEHILNLLLFFGFSGLCYSNSSFKKKSIWQPESQGKYALLPYIDSQLTTRAKSLHCMAVPTAFRFLL